MKHMAQHEYIGNQSLYLQVNGVSKNNDIVIMNKLLNCMN